MSITLCIRPLKTIQKSIYLAVAITILSMLLCKVNAATEKLKSAESEPKAKISISKDQQMEEKGSSTVNMIDDETQKELKRLSDVLHHEHRVIYQELRDEEELSTQDIAMLWQAAIERSGTLRFAISKLSRRGPTGQPVAGENFTTRILQSLAKVGGMAGSVWTGSPVGILGGGMVQDALRTDISELVANHISDADMLILAKEVETLQSEVIEAYYNYRHSKERWEVSKDASHTLDHYYKAFMNKVSQDDPEALALQSIMESLSQGIAQDEKNARQTFVSARNNLALLVGQDAISALEKIQTSENKSLNQD